MDQGVQDVTPDVAEPIRGYRVWRIGGFSLFSTAVRQRWQSQSMYMATCISRPLIGLKPPPLRRKPHLSPHPECSCGLYSWEKPQALAYYGKHALRLCLDKPQFICGALDMWGRVEQHKWGYRAQFARIAEFYRYPMHECYLTGENIAAFYQAPLVDPPPALAEWWEGDCGCPAHYRKLIDL